MGSVINDTRGWGNYRRQTRIHVKSFQGRGKKKAMVPFSVAPITHQRKNVNG